VVLEKLKEFGEGKSLLLEEHVGARHAVLVRCYTYNNA
jgi:hypothetical protein